MQTVFDVSGAAAVLGISKDTLRGLIRDGEIAAYDGARSRGKKRWKITSQALADFCGRRSNVQQAEPTSPPRRRTKAASPAPTRYY